MIVSFTLNDEERNAAVAGWESLLTVLRDNLGLSGSSIISLEASPEDPASAGAEAARENGITEKKVGISVFDDDELDIEPDPMGETQIAASVELPEKTRVGSSPTSGTT